MSQRICQDKFFGCQRQRGGTNENPNVSEFCKNSGTIRIVDSVCRAAVRGNCRGQSQRDGLSIEKASDPLTKRRKCRRKTI